MLPQLIAGGISFLAAKASGASTRNALLAGITGGVTSFGIGKLGAAIGGGVGSTEALKNLGLSSMLQSPSTQILGGSTIGSTVGTMGMPDPEQPKPMFSDADYAAALAREKLKPQTYETEEPSRSDLNDLYDFAPNRFGQTTFNQGGIVNAIPNFAKGGVNYLPSKIDHDEKDSNNYVRAHGYVEDGSGNGDKDEDTMLAQLADGEFVSRADAVLGAGIMAGANPEDFKEMRRKGATFFYNQQDQLKRIHDLVNAN